MLKETITGFSEDRAPRLAAATAYYAVFSIGPLLVLIVGVAGLVFGEETVRREVTQQAQSMLGQKSATLLSSMMSAQQKGGSLVATITGGVALVLGATGIFGQLQDALNTIWGVTSRPGQGLWSFIRTRFFSMAMVLGIGFLLLVSMALTAFVHSFAGYIGNLVALPGWVIVGLNAVLSFVVVLLLFALIFKVLPDVRIRWRDVWVGAIGTALLFTAGKYLLGLYLARQSNASAYGMGSAFVVILLYIYYSSMILYLGAEFTQVHARHHGTRIEPSKHAVLLTREQRAEQGIATRQEVEDAARRKAA
jgi:membrane protein